MTPVQTPEEETSRICHPTTQARSRVLDQRGNEMRQLGRPVCGNRPSMVVGATQGRVEILVETSTGGNNSYVQQSYSEDGQACIMHLDGWVQ